MAQGVEATRSAAWWRHYGGWLETAEVPLDYAAAGDACTCRSTHVLKAHLAFSHCRLKPPCHPV